MKRQKRRTDKQLQRIIGIVCLSFLLGTAGGALLANLLPQGQQGQLSAFLRDDGEVDAFLQQALADGDEISFAAIFWKYLKYDVIIWLGGWMQLGLFFAGAAFLFRSVCVGFTSAMMMAAYGMKGVLLSATAFLPQNLLLIPCYILMMSACVYYLLSWQEEGGKRTLKREKRRKQLEYCILFGGSVLLLAAASGVERMLLLL